MPKDDGYMAEIKEKGQKIVRLFISQTNLKNDWVVIPMEFDEPINILALVIE